MEVAADVVWAGVPLSLTVAVKLEVPLVEGVPEMIPVVAARPLPTFGSNRLCSRFRREARRRSSTLKPLA